MEKDLIVFENLPAPDVMFREGLDAVLAEIERKVLAFEYDLETAKGRKKIAAVANKVARSKTYLDKIGKELVAEWKGKSKKVDAERKKAREFLDGLKIKVRKPLTDWEDEQKRIEAERKLQEEIEAAEVAASEMNILFDKEREIEQREAELRRKEEARRAKESAERQAIEQRDREKRIATEAAAKAKREAEEAERLKYVKAELLRRQTAEIERKEREEAERLRAEESLRIEREKQAEIDRLNVEKQAIEAATIEAEKERQRRLADTAHKREVDKAILDKLIGLGAAPTAAENIVFAIKNGEIDNIRIEY